MYPSNTSPIGLDANRYPRRAITDTDRCPKFQKCNRCPLWTPIKFNDRCPPGHRLRSTFGIRMDTDSIHQCPLWTPIALLEFRTPIGILGHRLVSSDTDRYLRTPNGIHGHRLVSTDTDWYTYSLPPFRPVGLNDDRSVEQSMVVVLVF